MGGGARDIRLQVALLDGRHQVVEQRAVGAVAWFAQVVLDFGELVFPNPAAGGGLVLQVFQCWKQSAAETWQKLLGNDANQLRGEQVEGPGAFTR